MDASETSGTRIGRTIWTVWGYLTGAVARYLRPEVTDDENKNVYQRQDDVILKNRANRLNREENEEKNDEKEEEHNQIKKNTEEVKCSLPEARAQVASAQWEKTDVVNDDNNELAVDTTKKQTYHCAVWCTEADHRESNSGDVDSKKHQQSGRTGTLDVQIKNKNEESQIKSEAHVEKENDAVPLIESQGIESEQEPEECMDVKQKDCNSESEKEEHDRDEDDGEEYVMKKQDPDNTDDTIQSEHYGQDIEQEEMNSMENEETEDISEIIREKVVEHIKHIDEKEHKTIDSIELEKTENNDKGIDSQKKDGDLLSQLAYSNEEDDGLSRPFENERVKEMEKYLDEITESEVVQTPDRIVNDIVSKNEVEEMILETIDTAEQFKEIEKSEQCKGLDISELPGTQTAQSKNGDKPTSESEEALLGVSEEIFSRNEIGLKTPTVMDEFFETVDTLEDVVQSDLSKLDNAEAGTDLLVVVAETKGVFSDRIVCELPGELGKGSEIGLVKTEAMDQIKTSHKALGCFEQINTNVNKPFSLKEKLPQRETVISHSLQVNFEGKLKTSLKNTFQEATEVESDCVQQNIETPLLKQFLSSSQSQKLEEIDTTEFSLKEHVELRTELIVDTGGTKISSEEEKVEAFKTDSELLAFKHNAATLLPHELQKLREGECKLSQSTMNTISESLVEDEWGSSVLCEITGTDLSPVEIKHDVEELLLLETNVIEVKNGPAGSQPGLTSFLNSPESLMENLDFQGESERYTEGRPNSETEASLLHEKEAVKTTFEDVEEITNQVLKEMIEIENNLAQEMGFMVELSTEILRDADFQLPAESVPAGALVLQQEDRKEEREIVDEIVESGAEMEMDTAICEVVKIQKNVHHSISPEFEITKEDEGCEQMEKSVAGETVFHSHEDIMEISRAGIKRSFDKVNDLPETKRAEEQTPEVDCSMTSLDLQAFKDSSLDFSVQKSRIAVKNPLVRPPKNPRKLLYRSSVEPIFLKPSPHGLLKASQGVALSMPSKGFVGFRLPGLGAELPTLRKTDFGKRAREGGEAESRLHEQQKTEATAEDSVKEEQVSVKPKWTPPRHPGMGGPMMMAELKSKLKKPVQE